MKFLTIAFASSVASVASASIVVRVGATSGAEGGIFQYIPNTFNATNGTTVTFQFTGAPGNHTVTQSSFADPCDPLAGGFDSGWVSIPSSPALTAADTPEWNLTITDDTKRESAKSSTIDFLKLTTISQPFGSSANRYCPAPTARQVPICGSCSWKRVLLKFGESIRNGWCHQRSHHREQNICCLRSRCKSVQGYTCAS